MKQLVLILIIAHKSILTENEAASLKQCYKLLGHYPIKLICPEGLNISQYKKVNPNVQIEFIDPKWQSTYEMFNRLKMDSLLYNKFKNYQYILFYELDAWVFKDELEYWCKKGYDYIGAPWFEGWHNADKSSEIIGVGNGGFSLRNVQKAIKILRRIQKLKKIRKLWYRSKLQCVLRFEKMCRKFPFGLSVKNSVNLLNLVKEDYVVNEDFSWCKTVGSVFDDFNIAPVMEALQFSFDVNPSLLYSMNKNNLPFGCHAWERYEPEFWKDFIPDQLNERIK